MKLRSVRFAIGGGRRVSVIVRAGAADSSKQKYRHAEKLRELNTCTAHLPVAFGHNVKHNKDADLGNVR